ncbi:MAG TPA: glycosyltransferase family 4 protein, partial [Bacteroidales bacterium]|nr:glycosyltransferase family 4 protein [Bacteroidales bacterium]
KLNLFNYSWVISSTRFFMTSVTAGIYAKKNKIKWLHIEHGSDFVKLNSKLKSLLAKMFDYSFGRWILREADEVVTVSVAAAKFSKRLFSGRDYKVIYRGLELNKFKDNQKIKNKYKNKVIILYSGRLIDGKGVNDLINAVDKVSSNNWILLIAGDGSRKNDLKNQVLKLKLKNKVIFLGQIEREKLLGILNISDIVVNPSYTEGLPTSVLEAAKCGKAIVATNVGGTREIIENNISGILVRPKDISILSQKIETLIMDSNLRKQLGQSAKETVKNKFNWETSIKDYLNILK